MRRALATTHFPTLLQHAIRGEEVVITRPGEPLVTLVPVQASPTCPTTTATRSTAS